MKLRKKSIKKNITKEGNETDSWMGMWREISGNSKWYSSTAYSAIPTTSAVNSISIVSKNYVFLCEGKNLSMMDQWKFRTQFYLKQIRNYCQ